MILLLVVVVETVQGRSYTWDEKRGEHINSFLECGSTELAVSLCGSGKNKDCNSGRAYVTLGCAGTNQIGSERNFVSSSSIERDKDSHWQCGGAGQAHNCPSGKVIIGVCGSGREKDCRNHCDPDQHVALRCDGATTRPGIRTGIPNPM